MFFYSNHYCWNISLSLDFRPFFKVFTSILILLKPRFYNSHDNNITMSFLVRNKRTSALQIFKTCLKKRAFQKVFSHLLWGTVAISHPAHSYLTIEPCACDATIIVLPRHPTELLSINSGLNGTSRPACRLTPLKRENKHSFRHLASLRSEIHTTGPPGPYCSLNMINFTTF